MKPNSCTKSLQCSLQLPDNSSLTSTLELLEDFLVEDVMEKYTPDALSTKILYIETVDFQVSRYNEIVKIIKV